MLKERTRKVLKCECNWTIRNGYYKFNYTSQLHWFTEYITYTTIRCHVFFFSVGVALSMDSQCEPPNKHLWSNRTGNLKWIITSQGHPNLSIANPLNITLIIMFQNVFLSEVGTSTILKTLIKSIINLTFYHPPIKISGLRLVLFLWHLKIASTVTTFIMIKNSRSRRNCWGFYV